MVKIVKLKNNQRETHIVRGNSGKSSLCGCRFKRTHIKYVVEGNVELCSCQKCIKVLNANLHLFEK